MAETSLLDAHLAEIDRRLRAIQSDLEPVGDVRGAPPAVSEIAAPVVPETAAPEVSETATPVISETATPVISEGTPPVVCATVSAGPFDGLEALARFERGLRQLPGVRQVRLREYEGEDRAVYEVIVDAAIS